MAIFNIKYKNMTETLSYRRFNPLSEKSDFWVEIIMV